MLRVWANLLDYTSCEMAASAWLAVPTCEQKWKSKIFGFLKKIKVAGFSTPDAHVCHSCTDLDRACVGCVNSEWPGALLLTSGITVISVDWSDWSDSSPRHRNPAAGRAGGGRERGAGCVMQINNWFCFTLFGTYGHLPSEKNTLAPCGNRRQHHIHIYWRSEWSKSVI